MEVKVNLPLLPLRDIVVFPSMVIPLFVGRDKSISALNEVMKNDKKIILVTQKNSEVDDPKKTDVFMYGCESSILQLLKLPDGTVKVLVEGFQRAKLNEIKNYKDYYAADVSPLEEEEDTKKSRHKFIKLFDEYNDKKASERIINYLEERIWKKHI